MTDSDIIKALESCGENGGGCLECPLFSNYKTCMHELITFAKIYVKRQQVEIEQLKAENADLEAKTEKQYEQARADILGNMADGGASCHWCIAEHKKNAVKDFAERLKARVREAANEQPDGGHICESEIDGIINELVAEMEG